MSGDALRLFRRKLAVRVGREMFLDVPCEHRSEEHTSELQSRSDLVCRLLLEKKKAHVRTPVTIRHPMPPSACKIKIRLSSNVPSTTPSAAVYVTPSTVLCSYVQEPLH